jgi:putative ABC transport system permease protein
MIAHDGRFALRTLRKQPVFALTAILTLALGIGATTAIFSVVNGLVLRDLPYPNPGQLFFLRTAMTDGRATGGQVSPAELVAIAERSQSILAASGAFRFEGALDVGSSEPVAVVYFAVAPKFFEVAGLPMALGRGFKAQEDAIGGPPAAVMSWATWRDRFGASPDVIGTTLRLDGRSVPVVGVAPREFDFPRGTALWVAAQLPPTMTNHIYDAYLRGRDGLSAAQIQSELALLSTQLQEQYPGANRNRVLAMQPLLEYTVGNLRGTLFVLLGGALTLLLIACVNVTNLMLSRGEVRAREIATRVAVGARRRRILTQLLTESLVLAAAGSVAGLLLAFAGVQQLLRLAPADLPRRENVAIDGAVVLFALALTAVVGVVVGFAPALRLLLTDVRTLVNEGGRGGSAGPWRQRLLGGLVVAEIALAIVLVVGAGLLVRSFDRLSRVDPGFRAERVIAFPVNLSPSAYPDYDRVGATYRQLLERLRALGGVENVSLASSLPLSGRDDFMQNLQIEGEPPREEPLRARIRSAGDAYFTTAGVRMVAGRPISDRDRADTAPVVVVNEAFVRAFLPGQDPIGRRVLIPSSPLNDPANVVGLQRASAAEIVGVAADVRHVTLADLPEASIYQPHDQLTYRTATVLVRTAGDPSTLAAGIRREVAAVDRSLPVELRLLSQVVDASLSRQRLGMLLMIAFGLAALALAAVGIYGVMAYAVTQRRREMAIRAALGATAPMLRSLVVRHGSTLAAVGIVAGLVASAGMSRLLASQLHEISPFDIVVFTAVPLLLSLVVLVAVVIPSLTAARVDPALMLRNE